VLRLSPHDFWTMTPCEWNAAVAGWQAAHGVCASAPLGRADLEALMRTYPDKPHE
jgi:uncharacterized phage protein (TIGR02216 family)